MKFRRLVSGILTNLTILCTAAHLIAAEKPTLVLDAGGHTGTVGRVLISPNGKEVYSISADKTIRIWDAASGESLRTLRPPIGNGNEGSLISAALTPDGTRLAVAGVNYDAPIYLISLGTGHIERVFLGHENGINDLRFSSDARLLISGSYDQTARIWDVNTGNTVHVLKGHSNGVFAVTFSPDDRQCATASLDHTAVIWSVDTGQRLRELKGHSSEVISIAWRPDNLVLATGSMDHSIRFWSPEGKAYQAFDNPDHQDILSLAFTPDSRRLLYTTLGSREKLPHTAMLDIRTKTELVRFDEHTNTIQHGSLSRDGTIAATTGGNHHEIFLWKTSDGTRVQKLIGKSRVPWAVAWNLDGTRIAWGNDNDRTVPTFDHPNMVQRLENAFSLADLEHSRAADDGYARARPEVGSLSLIPGPYVSGYARTVLVREANRTLATLPLYNAYDRVRCFTLLPDDRAVVGSDFGLRVFDARTGKYLRDLQGHEATIWAVSQSPDGRYLLTASGDMTIRVWNLDAKVKLRTPREVFPKKYIEGLEAQPQFASLIDAEDGIARMKEEFRKAGESQSVLDSFEPFEAGASGPLLSCSFAGDDWIVWTPEGYYAASPGGEKLMGWHVNNGRDQMASFYPAGQFRSALYRPDVIKLLLKTGSVERALVEANRVRGLKTSQTEVSRVLPPRVQIVSPTNGLTSPENVLEIHAKAYGTETHPVTALRLLLDGRPYQGQKGIQTIGAPKLGETQGTWKIDLEPGQHKLKVLADTAVSQGASEEIEVIYFGGGTETVQLPKLYIVAIGITDYPGDLKLNYAAKDAEAVGNALKLHSKMLFREIEVQTITNAAATRQGVLKGLNWLRGQMTQNDYGIFFFAGHGELDNDGALYFLPIDGDAGDLISSAVPADQVKRVLSGIPGKLITIFDACHSAGIAGSETGKRRAGKASLTDDLVRDLVTDENGVIAMCSSTGREFSLENNQFRQGSFTLAIVEGLSGKADFNKDGVVYLNELDTYVTDRVKELTRGQQHPVTAKPGSIRSFPVAKP